ncbi:MAG TPA: alanine acetyltransferase, partial [Xanthomonadaceae bacterium]|nr:alanine acetyltransferase [Xanthomonadaceae bacterium]
MSETAGAPLWSDLQVSWLQALGHTVYLDRSSLPEPVAAVAPARPAEAPVRT